MKVTFFLNILSTQNINVFSFCFSYTYYVTNIYFLLLYYFKVPFKFLVLFLFSLLKKVLFIKETASCFFIDQFYFLKEFKIVSYLFYIDNQNSLQNKNNFKLKNTILKNKNNKWIPKIIKRFYSTKFKGFFKLVPSSNNRKIIKCKQFKTLFKKTHDFFLLEEKMKNTLSSSEELRYNIYTFTSKPTSVENTISYKQNGNILQKHHEPTFIHKNKISLDKKNVDKLDVKVLNVEKKTISRESFSYELLNKNTVHISNDTCELWEKVDPIDESTFNSVYDSLE